MITNNINEIKQQLEILSKQSACNQLNILYRIANISYLIKKLGIESQYEIVGMLTFYRNQFLNRPPFEVMLSLLEDESLPYRDITILIANYLVGSDELEKLIKADQRKIAGTIALSKFDSLN